MYSLVDYFKKYQYVNIIFAALIIYCKKKYFTINFSIKLLALIVENLISILLLLQSVESSESPI